MQGVRIKEALDQRIANVGKEYLFETSGIGGATIDQETVDRLTVELNALESLQSQMDKELVPVMGILAAFDISCPDHNDAIRREVMGALENREVVLTTKSLLVGVGSKTGEGVNQLHEKLQERNEDYHYWIDDGSQFVLLIPKKYGPGMKPRDLLRTLDFNPSKWVRTDSDSLIESSYAKPQFDRFLDLFTQEPKVRKQWALSGHGGGEDVCGMSLGDYQKFYEFLNKQHTQFVYVSSCRSGAHKEYHLQKSSFPVVLGTYTGEVHYGTKIDGKFFSKLNGILSVGTVKSIRPFEKLFYKRVKGGQNDMIIFLPDTPFSFQLLHKDRKGKDLYQVDLTRAKCEKKPINLRDKEKVCIHTPHVDVKIEVGEKTALFPYKSGDWIEIDQLETPDAYFEFLRGFYHDISLQKGCFLIHHLNGQQDVLWVLDKDQASQWHLPTIGFRQAAAIQEAVGNEKFYERVIPLLSEECKKNLHTYQSILEKGGLDLNSEENAIFKKNWKLIVSTLFKNGQFNSGLIERLSRSKVTKGHLLLCCIKHKRMDLITDLRSYQPAIGKDHFQEAIRLGDVSLWNALRELNPDEMPKELSDCMLAALEGGEEIMIELYRYLTLTPDSECYPGYSLFKASLDLGWTKLADIMMDTGKPKAKSLMVKDDPLNLLIDAYQQDSRWKPFVTKALQKGWHQSEFEEYGHRDLPINRVMRLGMFDVFLELLETYSKKELQKFCYYLPLSEAMEQQDSRYLEILFSLKTFDTNAEVSPGVTLICKAVKLKNYKAVELLIAHGAKVHLPDPYLDQPLSLAFKLEDKRMIQLLMENGATELPKEDYPQLIKLIKEFKNDEEMVWKLLFLAYRKPSLCNAELSRELVQFFYKHNMKAQVQWIVCRSEKQHQYNAGAYLELFVRAGDRQMIEDYLKFQGKIENKAAIARVLKKALQEGLEEPIIIEILERELSRF